ncbi:MAG: YHS domain protein [Flavobacterium sp. MedPE-SWcel]|uniref:YHS domain-containing (seleno)protein n=1 Tax=uncultured Flavobacterium sp. TaxID=165435 RepID=UPI00091F1AB8|nr:YHS domain-containing (seleno)protein [uncultured Flavobacterium sp.]OIQ22490.1 MAG: YHS domain protein [Flavobacterium sp. MedPE-SWcel]
MKKQIVITALLLFISIGAFAQKTDHRNLDKKVAIEGYDPVAYFKDGEAVEGKKKNALNYKGAIYYFSTQANKASFKSNPSKYEPQYGGWCAYAMGDSGEKVEVDPETFKIIDGKLYLFYNRFFNNTLKSWNKNQTALKNKANNNWKKIISL